MVALAERVSPMSIIPPAELNKRNNSIMYGGEQQQTPALALDDDKKAKELFEDFIKGLGLDPNKSKQ